MSDLKLYRIKHIPTGLFYTPLKGYGTGHLAFKGKVYTTKPNLNHVSTKIQIPPTYKPKSKIIQLIIEKMGETVIEVDRNQIYRYLNSPHSDWEITEEK